MGLLDNLKEQADQDISKQLDTELSKENTEYVFDVLIAPKMKQIYFYFKEFTQHLNVIKQTIKIPAYSKQFPNMGELSQVEYKISSDGSGGVVDHDKIQTIQLRYRYKGLAVKEYVHHTDSKLEADQITDFLTSRKISYASANNLASKNNGALTFYITKDIPVVFKFTGNPETSKILLNIKNHENFEERILTINPVDIDEAYLDKLARYILRKDSDFLNIDIDDQVRIQIRQRMETEKKAKQAEKEAEEKAKTENETEEKSGKSFFSKLFK
ncbi:MAG: hypothetical protein KZQ83_07690 [gamma proteobacterium symbiont of Taylorina sp.]|nr:hypothetical protein [gamma proteobacterium symbiont of Taylorina sp.]